MQPAKTLVFIYNIDSGVLAKIKDYAGLESSPATDFCRLYTLTNSPIGIKKEWKRFIKELGIPGWFLNRNEFSTEFGTGLTTFPAIFLQVGENMSLVVGSDEINQCQVLEDLISLVRPRFANIH